MDLSKCPPERPCWFFPTAVRAPWPHGLSNTGTVNSFLHHDLGMATGDGNGRNGHSACSVTNRCSYPGTLETLENGHEVTSGCRCRSLWTLPPETAKLFSLSSPIPLPNLKMTPNITGWPTYFSETAVLQKH